MQYMNTLYTDFLGEQEKEKCHSCNDMGRACNMSHAEQVAGEGS